MKRIFPRYAPNWFRPVWCIIKGYHRDPLEIPVSMSLGAFINCGCCAKRRATIVTAKFGPTMTLGELDAAAREMKLDQDALH